MKRPLGLPSFMDQLDSTHKVMQTTEMTRNFRIGICELDCLAKH